MVNLILPAAGQSTRFPNMRPKWLLVHPWGHLMVTAALQGLDQSQVDAIYLIVQREQLDAHATEAGITQAFIDAGITTPLHLLALPEPTRNQPETVVRAIEHFGIQGPIFVKDVDNSFSCSVQAQNALATHDLQRMGLVNAANKSYITTDDNGLVNNIVEKRVIGSQFCVGGYSFERAQDFVDYFHKQTSDASLYISHLIFNMILDGAAFRAQAVTAYEDWGTLAEWNRYKSTFATIFVDLDGVLVKNSAQYFEPKWGTTKPLARNVELINRLQATGRVQVLVTTTRKEAYRDITLKQLQDIGLVYNEVVFNLPHARRIVVNDYSLTNPYPSCQAINIKRDSDDLEELLKLMGA